ncbi:MAG: hypothetical protein ABMB14_06705 [Myxococcota bacterium]
MTTERREERDAALSTLAAGLGLERIAPTLVAGELDGAPIRIEVRAELGYSGGKHRHRRPEDDRLVVQVDLPFWPTLDAGLKVDPRPEAPDADGFPPRFAPIHAIEPDRGEALVSPGARTALAAAWVAGELEPPGVWVATRRRGPGAPAVTDRSIRWTRSHRLPFPNAVIHLPPIRALPVAWREIHAAALAVRPASGTEGALVELARWCRPGIELCGAPSGLVGAAGPYGFVASLRPDGDAVWGTVGIRFPDRLDGAPLVLAEADHGFIARFVDLLDGRPERTVGDTAFDDRFAVRTRRPEALLAMLGPAVRAAMLHLDEVHPIRLDADGIRGVAQVDPAAFTDVASRALALAEALAAG